MRIGLLLSGLFCGFLAPLLFACIYRPMFTALVLYRSTQFTLLYVTTTRNSLRSLSMAFHSGKSSISPGFQGIVATERA